ncbi:MAG: hypothetical protein V9E93_03710 [Steroidobacteraceae bacterium]
MTHEACQRAMVEQDAGVGEDHDLAHGALEPRVQGSCLAGADG